MLNYLIIFILIIAIILTIKLIKNITKTIIILIILIIFLIILNSYISNEKTQVPTNITNSTIIQTGATIITNINKDEVKQTLLSFKQKLETFINKLILN